MLVSTGARIQRWWCNALIADNLLIAGHVADGRKAAHCHALAGDSLHVLKQTNTDLRAKLAKLEWPRLTSFRFNGQSFLLPVRSENRDTRLGASRLTTNQLAYLAGFFDGDGCVVATADKCRLSLRVSQSVDGVEVLMHFQRSLGGSICHLSDGVGLRKPSLHWTLSGRNARHAASLLAPFSIVKRKQLEIVAEWPAERADRVDSSEKLSLLKRSDSGLARTCTWAFLAGFFDAEGCIERRREHACLNLRMSQKYITVLECAQSFLASEMGYKPHIYQMSRHFELQIGTTSTCKLILQRMLDAGLLRKAAQAKLALSLTSENAEEVRSKMADMVGNQQFGKRFDAAGLRRAKAITSARERAKRAEKKGQESKSVWAEVEQLKYEHALLNAQREADELRAFVDHVKGLHENSGSGEYEVRTTPGLPLCT